MSLSPRAIATQGLGLGARPTAVQGLCAVEQPQSWPARGSYRVGDIDPRDDIIRAQNRTFITLLIGLAAAGAFE